MGINNFIRATSRPFCIGFAYDDSLDDKIDEILSPDYVSPRVHLIPYHMNDTNTYPINLLRNLAINAVTTSHFWLTDMDMWPAGIFASIALFLFISELVWGSAQTANRNPAAQVLCYDCSCLWIHQKTRLQYLGRLCKDVYNLFPWLFLVLPNIFPRPKTN